MDLSPMLVTLPSARRYTLRWTGGLFHYPVRVNGSGMSQWFAIGP